MARYTLLQRGSGGALVPVAGYALKISPAKRPLSVSSLRIDAVRLVIYIAMVAGGNHTMLFAVWEKVGVWRGVRS